MGGKALKSNANGRFVSYVVCIMSYVENVMKVEGIMERRDISKIGSLLLGL